MKFTTLVVDDNPAKLYTITRVLEREGYNIIEAVSGAEAIVKSKENPDLIVLDVKLPDINGFEVCKIIKNSPETSSIPVVFISANFEDIESKLDGLASGGDTYLTDPVDPRLLLATVNSIMRIRQAEAKLKRATLQWQATFDSMSEGICLLNVFGQIERSNKSFFRLTGFTEAWVTDKPIHSLHKSFNIFTADYFFNYYKNSSDFVEEIIMDGKWFRISISPILDEKEKFTGSVFSITDITELKRIFFELERSNHELEQFAYVVSHDLREPLRMITRYSQMLVSKFKTAGNEASELVDFITEGTGRMQQLISDLLTYSRISTQAKKLNNVDLNNIVKEVVSGIKYYLEERNGSVNFSNLPSVLINPGAAFQLFQNLIINGLKFNKSQNPSVIISCTEQGNSYLIEIKDNGIGIDPKYKDRVFVIFQRLHHTEDYQGTGLGLAICKKIVEHSGGNIWMEPGPGAGTSFFFTLPKNK